MGCGSSKVTPSHATNPQTSIKDPKSTIKASWEQAENSVKKNGGQQTDLVFHRTDWKTVRIFVSSTFKDFHQEREILVKKVWLKKWKHLLIINIIF